MTSALSSSPTLSALGAGETETAPAKLNLSLHITGRRDDGYHLLDSIFVFTDGGDVIHVEDSDQFTLTLEGPFAPALAEAGGAGDSNLVMKAAKMLAERAGVKKAAAITLQKNLPVASGIGGGSSDAAATLRALIRLWDLSDFPHEELYVLALALGADVPPCLTPTPARVQGVGEVITPLQKEGGLPVLLANPLVAVETPSVFKAFKAASTPFSPALSGTGLTSAKADHNALQAPAFDLVASLRPALDTLANLPGVAFARMSGSGATLFALFETEEAASNALAEAERHLPGWWLALDRVTLPQEKGD